MALLRKRDAHAMTKTTKDKSCPFCGKLIRSGAHACTPGIAPPELGQPRDKDGMPDTTKHYSRWFCALMNVIDFRYWGCECHWWAPYGRVIHMGCKRHD